MELASFKQKQKCPKQRQKSLKNQNMVTSAQQIKALLHMLGYTSNPQDPQGGINSKVTLTPSNHIP